MIGISFKWDDCITLNKIFCWTFTQRTKSFFSKPYESTISTEAVTARHERDRIGMGGQTDTTMIFLRSGCCLESDTLRVVLNARIIISVSLRSFLFCLWGMKATFLVNDVDFNTRR